MQQLLELALIVFATSVPSLVASGRGQLPTKFSTSAAEEPRVATFFVDTRRGDDLAAGTEAAPFRTLHRAQDAVRGLPPPPPPPPAAAARARATVFLRAGVFSGPGNVPLVFTAADRGTVWQAYRGEEVLVSGGLAVPDAAFSPHPTLPGVCQANLTALGGSRLALGQVGGNESTGTALDRSGRFGAVGAFAELFYRGQPMQLAGWPNRLPDDVVNYSHTAGGFPQSCVQEGFGCQGNCTGFMAPTALPLSKLQRWQREATERNPWLQGFFTW